MRLKSNCCAHTCLLLCFDCTLLGVVPRWMRIYTLKPPISCIGLEELVMLGAETNSISIDPTA